MSRKKNKAEAQWEWRLIEAYHDYRWCQVLEPLYEKFQRWKAGELSHMDMDDAIHQTHKENQQLYSFFRERKSWLVTLIKLDEEWFQAWGKDNPPPQKDEEESR